MTKPFHMQPVIVEAEENGEPYQRTEYVDEPPHVVRVIRTAGSGPRGDAKYLRKKNRIAKRNGFRDAAHQTIFLALLAAKKLKQQVTP